MAEIPRLWYVCAPCGTTWHRNGGLACFICGTRGEAAEPPDVRQPMHANGNPDGVPRFGGVW